MTNLLMTQASKQANGLFATTLLFLNLSLVAIGALMFLGLPASLAETADLQAWGPNPQRVGLVVAFMGLWGMVAGQTAVRRRLAAWTKLDPDSTVHLLALLLAGYLVGGTAVTLVQGGLDRVAETAVAVTVNDVVLQQGLFALVALFGVGLLTRRTNEEVNDRLGLVPLTAVSLKTAVRWVALLVAIQWLIGGVWFLLNPSQAQQLSEISGALFSEFDTVWEWFALAVASGIGEELLFRGALQPIFGLWPTTFLFAVAHVQYGITPATLAIFAVGFGLGTIRSRHNTTTAIVVHFGYNFTLGMLALLALYLEPLVAQ